MNFKNLIIFSELFVIIILLSGCQSVEEVGGCQLSASLEDYELVWSDEFDGTEIDASKWSYDLGDGCQISDNLCGWGNNELEYYTDRPENSFLEDGNLVIKAIQEIPFFEGQHRYTSARMVTKNKGDWKFGRIDVRAKLPIGKGLWPAIWMLPTDNVYGGWPRSGEIDIMENIGSEPSKVSGTIHYGHDFWRFNSQSLELEDGFFADDFHVFTLLWDEDCILFQVDGVDIGVPNTRSTVLPTTYPFDQDFHLILNVAVGGTLPGNPDASTSFPQTMEIDYVRVFQ
jgi:Beta-glucanase/Beta-glucan synthetase